MAIGYVRGSLSQTGTTITLTSGGNKTIIATTSGAADKTVTLPAHNLAITTSAASSVTLPTSGTLISTDSSAAITGSMIAADTITNTNINASAAIAYSKLNLGTSIVNADISGSAAIAYSKLNLATSIVNADIAAGAAIALSKLAALAVSKAVVTDGSGVLTTATTTAAELDYLSGVTGAIQTQIDGKVTKPGSATDNHVVRLDGVDGTMQTSVVVVNDGGNVSGIADLDMSGNLNLSGSINKTAASLSIGASIGANNLTLGGATSTVVIPGNLEVQGDTTTINTNNTTVEDANIQINYGGTNGSASNSGITVVKGWDASTDSGLIWDTTAKRFKAGQAGSEATVALASDKLSAFASTTSAELAGVVSDETGSGSLVFATSPSLVTPSLGVATATSINSTTIPSSKTLVVTTDKLSALAATTSAELAGVISDETGSGALVFGTSPSIATPVLDKPVVNQVDVTQAASATTPAAGKSALYVNSTDQKLHIVDSAGADAVVGTEGSGFVPLGGLIPIAADLTGSFAIPPSGTVSAGWMVCDGAVIPGGNTVSGNTPDLSDGRFIRGSNSAGGTGGLDSITLVVGQLPSHSHGLNSHNHSIGHDHASFLTSATGGGHNHTYDRISSSPPSADTASGAPWGNKSTNTGGTGYHQHTIDLGAYSGNSGPSAGNTTDTGSNTPIIIIPTYLSAIYIIRVN